MLEIAPVRKSQQQKVAKLHIGKRYQAIYLVSFLIVRQGYTQHTNQTETILMKNRLNQTASPYLRAHADNPIH